MSPEAQTKDPKKKASIADNGFMCKTDASIGIKTLTDGISFPVKTHKNNRFSAFAL